MGIKTVLLLYYIKMVRTSTLLEWINMTKNILTKLQRLGYKMASSTTDNSLSFQDYCALFQLDLEYSYMDTGAHYELDMEEYIELEYERYQLRSV